ncbi:F-box/kelch-repeat protein At3g23880-like [Nicotiana tabacum]|uniref:F-box/kelch-repeat protein At3g23880-like n=1 Tax=Nicotiana tabacum TaxID=4097 RepID=A0AC58SMC1_TOBAC
MPNNLPHDITINILIKLPVKSLLRFKCISKSWRSLIEDDTYKSHKIFVTGGDCDKTDDYFYSIDGPLQHDSIASLLKSPIPEITKLSSVCFINGILVLILPCYPYDLVVFWNPAISKSRIIQCPILRKRERTTNWKQFHAAIYGVGYVSSTDDYKIIRVGQKYYSSYYNVHIYSTNSNSWKLMGKFHPNNKFFDGDIVTVDGIVYIIAITDLCNISPNDFTIVRFNLEKEKFQEILFPDRIKSWEDPALCTLGENLCLTRLHNDSRRDFEVWYMTKNGMSYSWSKMLTIPSVHCGRCLRPVSFMIKNGDILFLWHKGEFVVYNSKKHKLEEVKVAGLEAPLYFNWVVPYVETLFFPKS